MPETLQTNTRDWRTVPSRTGVERYHWEMTLKTIADLTERIENGDDLMFDTFAEQPFLCKQSRGTFNILKAVAACLVFPAVAERETLSNRCNAMRQGRIVQVVVGQLVGEVRPNVRQL